MSVRDIAPIGKLVRDRETRARALQSYQRLVEVPLTVLAVAVIPLLVLPLAMDLDPALNDAFFAFDWVIWAAFAMDLTVRLYLTEQRRRYLIAHWYDVLIVVIPFLRPLRVLRASRAVTFSVRFFSTARAIAGSHGLAYVLMVAAFITLASASLVFVLERNEGGTIDDFGTALWWAVVTVTTVGYGDVVPVTAEARGVAFFLMFVGISMFGFLAASVAAFLVEQGREDESKATLDDVLAKLNALEREIQHLHRESATPEPGRPSLPSRPSIGRR